MHFLPAEYKDKNPSTSWLTPSEEDKNSVVGLCGVHNAPEIGYAFHPSVWGKGVATEAIRGLIKAYLEVFPSGHPALEGAERRYLVAYTDPWNGNSENVLKKNGFEFWREEEKEEESDGNRKSYVLNLWRLWRPGFASPKESPDGDKVVEQETG